jgi:RimJ/RimL family protein N-acetyltransferase
MPILQTERLRFLPMTCEQAETALHGGAAALQAYTGLHVPPGMLTPLLVERVLPVRLAKLQHDPELADWYGWVVHLDTQTLIGTMGFKSKPDDHGTVEIRYGLHEDWRGQGLATEMVGALIHWAFTQPDVQRITATDVDPENLPSISLLRNLGMTLVAETRAGLSFTLSRP